MSEDEERAGAYVPLRDQAPPPDRFPVTVLMRSSPAHDHPWLTHRWEVVGVMARPDQTVAAPAADDAETAERIVRFDGLVLRLYADEAESYYHNLTVDQPRCFVVCRADEQGTPVPVLVTASFDQANAYFEGDERVDAVPMPESLYPAIESFVLTHYVPTERKKRKRKDWKSS